MLPVFRVVIGVRVVLFMVVMVVRVVLGVDVRVVVIDVRCVVLLSLV